MPIEFNVNDYNLTFIENRVERDHRHHPVNVHTAGAQVFLMDYI
jgi:hypothetical protein